MTDKRISTCFSPRHTEAPARVAPTPASSALSPLVPHQPPASEPLQGKDDKDSSMDPSISKYSSLKTYKCVRLPSFDNLELHSENSQWYHLLKILFFYLLIKLPLSLKSKINRKTHLILAPAPYLPGQHCLLLCNRKMKLHIFIEF